MRDHSSQFEPIFQRAKVDVARAHQELADAESALWKTLINEVGSQMIRDAIMVKAHDYAVAYRGIVEAEQAEETSAYVDASVAEIGKILRADAFGLTKNGD